MKKWRIFGYLVRVEKNILNSGYIIWCMDDFELTIRRPLINRQLSVHEQLQHFAYSLGIITERDRDKTCYRIFLVLMKKEHRNGLSSTDIAEMLNVTRGTIVYHLNRLISSGIVHKHKGKYYFRSQNLTTLIDEMHKEVIINLELIKRLARDLDEECDMI